MISPGAIFIGGALDPDTGEASVTLRIGNTERLLLAPDQAVATATMLGRWAGFIQSANEHRAAGGCMTLFDAPPEGSA